jgi:homoserine kinase
MPPSSRPRDIVVPGSVSNLGPAFDALSVAVNVYLRLRILEVRPEAPGTLEVEFGGAPPPGENRIAVAFRRAAERDPTPVPGVRVRAHSDIPVRAGLGSSAAATVAGLRLYAALAGMAAPAAIPRYRDDDLLAIATAIEGHPDNAAAALLGGLTVSCQREDGRVLARAWRWPVEVRFVVATPRAELETTIARQMLPSSIPLADAVYNLQRALLLMRALDSGRYDDLREAVRDCWHQPARQASVPGLAEALALDHPAILGVFLSGAGPSIAALTAGGEAQAAELLGGIYTRLGLPYTIRALSAHQPAQAGRARRPRRPPARPAAGARPESQDLDS